MTRFRLADLGLQLSEVAASWDLGDPSAAGCTDRDCLCSCLGQGKMLASIRRGRLSDMPILWHLLRVQAAG